MDSKNPVRFESDGVFKIASGFGNECELIESNFLIGPNVVKLASVRSYCPLQTVPPWISYVNFRTLAKYFKVLSKLSKLVSASTGLVTIYFRSSKRIMLVSLRSLLNNWGHGSGDYYVQWSDTGGV
jgi:hypothetical protein